MNQKGTKMNRSLQTEKTETWTKLTSRRTNHSCFQVLQAIPVLLVTTIVLFMVRKR